jgi:hypothetical protein
MRKGYTWLLAAISALSLEGCLEKTESTRCVFNSAKFIYGPHSSSPFAISPENSGKDIRVATPPVIYQLHGEQLYIFSKVSLPYCPLLNICSLNRAAGRVSYSAKGDLSQVSVAFEMPSGKILKATNLGANTPRMIEVGHCSPIDVPFKVE